MSGAQVRTLVPVATVVAVALSLTACGEDTPTPGTSSSPSVKALTDDEIRALLPGEGSVPGDWTQVDGQATTDPEQTTYPLACEDLRFSGPAADEHEDSRAGTARRGYLLPVSGDSVNALAVQVTSYKVPVPGDLFDLAGQALPKCSDYQQINKDGTRRYTAESITGPSWGDRTFRYRTVEKARDQTTDVLTFALGNNLVRIVHVYNEGDYNPKGIELLAEATAERLKGSAG